MTAQDSLKVLVPPILREALASVRPGEDIDEALLRALKARYPDEATSLLSALARLVALEAERAREDREQTIRRLAAADPGPEIVLKTTSGPPGQTSGVTHVSLGRREYRALEEMPPELRRVVERNRPRASSCPRVGCSWALLASFAALLRAAR